MKWLVVVCFKLSLFNQMVYFMKRTKFSKHCHKLFAFAKKDTNVNKYFKEKKQTKTQHIKFLEMKEKWKTVFFSSKLRWYVRYKCFKKREELSGIPFTADRRTDKFLCWGRFASNMMVRRWKFSWVLGDILFIGKKSVCKANKQGIPSFKPLLTCFHT